MAGTLGGVIPKRACILVAALTVWIPSTLHGLTKTFTGTASQDWSTDSNWNPAGVPAANDDVVLSANKIVNLAAPEAVNHLTMSAGTLTGTGSLTVAGLLTWSGGTMSGAGSTEAVAGLTLSGASTKSLNRTLINRAAATWNDAGNLVIGSGGVFSNQQTATFTAQNNQSISSGGGSPRFDNIGQFIKAGSGTTTVGIPFNNTGSVVVQSGTLYLTGGETSTGSFDSTGATLQFGNGVHNLSAAATVTGGSVVFSAGTVNHAGSYSATSTTVSAGVVNFTGTAISTGSLSQSGGTLGGSAAVSVTGALNWSGGTMSGSGQTTANGTLLISGSGTKSLSRTLNNTGAATWQDPGNIIIGSGGVFSNGPQATFTAQNDQTISSGGGSPRFDNAGSFNKTTGLGTTQVGIAFNNTGSVLVQTGTLNLAGGGTSGGTFNCVGAKLQFGGGTHTLSGSVTGKDVVISNGTMNHAGTFSVSGSTTISAGSATFSASVSSTGALAVTGGTLTISNSEGVLALPALTISGGTLTGTSHLTVSGPLNWSGGSMSGSGQTTANGPLALSGAGVKSLSRTLTNAGTATWQDAGNIVIGSGGVFSNQASFTAQNDQTISSGGGSPRFDNFGSFTKSPGLGTSTVSGGIAFNNTGSVDVQTGTLTLSGGGTSSGSFQCNGTTLRFGGGIHNLTQDATISGSTAVFSGGTTNLAGMYAITGDTTVSGGSATFTGTVSAIGPLTISGGTLTLSLSAGVLTAPSLTLSNGTLNGTSGLTLSELLNWSAGTMSGSGQTTANGTLSLNGSGGKVLNRTLVNAGSGTWTDGGALYMGTGGVFLNSAQFDLQSDPTIYWNDGSPHFDNTGVFTKEIGGGTTAYSGSLRFNNSGTVEIRTGTLSLGSGGYLQTAGTTRLNGGSLATLPGVPLVIQGGSLEGVGTITGDLSNGGEVKPGLSPGLLTVSGAYTQMHNGTLSIEIAGTAASQFDRLAVGGVATLDGTLKVTLTDGFVPSAGNTFAMMTFSGHSGDFSTTSTPALGDGNVFNENVGPSSLTLAVGPPVSATPTASATPTPISTAAFTATSTPGSSTTPSAACRGDCSGNNQVTVDEILTLVNVALGNVSVENCAPGDGNHDQEITVDEILVAVNSALNGCPAISTPETQAAAVAGAGPVIGKGMAGLSSLITALVAGVQYGSVAAATDSAIGGAAGSCPLSGSVTQSCTGTGAVTLNLALSAYAVPTSEGSILLDNSGGILKLQGTGACPTTIFPPVSLTATGVNATLRDSGGSVTASHQMNVTGSATLAPGGPCTVNSVNLNTLNGTVTTDVPGAETVTLTFHSTAVSIYVSTFSAQCLPLVYSFGLDGRVTIGGSFGSFDIIFSQPLNHFNVLVDARNNPTSVSLTGGVSAACFGGVQTLSTPEGLPMPSGSFCPTGGRLLIGTLAQIFYRSNGVVDLDMNQDSTIDQSFPSCTGLIQCPS